MTHKAIYIELTHLMSVFKALLKDVYSIHSVVKLEDHSVGTAQQAFNQCLDDVSIVYQFQMGKSRGFVLFSDDLGQWLVSQLLGVYLPNQSSMLESFSYQLFIDDGFNSSDLFHDFQLIDKKSIWIHPEFDQFYPMSFSIFKSPNDAIKNWIFIPKELDK